MRLDVVARAGKASLVQLVVFYAFGTRFKRADRCNEQGMEQELSEQGNKCHYGCARGELDSRAQGELKHGADLGGRQRRRQIKPAYHDDEQAKERSLTLRQETFSSCNHLLIVSLVMDYSSAHCV